MSETEQNHRIASGLADGFTQMHEGREKNAIGVDSMTFPLSQDIHAADSEKTTRRQIRDSQFTRPTPPKTRRVKRSEESLHNDSKKTVYPPTQNHIELQTHTELDDATRYLQEFRKIPLLSQDEEIELAKRIERGKKSRNKFYSLAIKRSRINKLINRADEAKNKKSPAREFAEYTRLRKKSDDLKNERDKITQEIRTTDAGQAFDQFISANLRLVVANAKRFIGQGLSLEDLIAEGNIGLIRAIDRFDWRKGYKFSTYATWWIKQAITRAIAEKSRSIRIPVHMFDFLKSYDRTKRQLAQELGRDPKPEEIANSMDISEDLLRERLAPPTVDDATSYNLPLNEQTETELGDVLPDEYSLPEEATKELLKDVIRNILHDALTERERTILMLRFGLEDDKSHTLEEVGKKLHVTRERIRQIETQALRKLRHPFIAQKIRDFIQ